MALIFYPAEELSSISFQQKLEVLLEAAEQYKAIILDTAAKKEEDKDLKKRATPRDLAHAFNWQELAILLRQLRELTESTDQTRRNKAEYLLKLAEIYEVLRAAKMPKLEAVRIALVSEARQLGNSSSNNAA